MREQHSALLHAKSTALYYRRLTITQIILETIHAAIRLLRELDHHSL